MIVRTIQRVFINTHAITALYASCMTWLSLELVQSKDPLLISFVFWSTLSAYNFHTLINFNNKKENYKNPWNSGHKNYSLLVFIISCIILCTYVDFFSKHIFLFVTAVLATLMYSLPNLPQKPFQWLRKIAIAKTFFLAAVWTYVTVFIPFTIHLDEWHFSNSIYVLQRFLFIYAICILFDVRDKEEDLLKGIRSISTMINPKWTSVIYYSSVIVSMALSIAMYKEDFALTIATCIPSAIALLVYDTYKSKSIFFYTVFLDGLMALSAFIYFISQFDLFLHS